MSEQNQKFRKVSWPQFLLDVMVCSLGAYGGPSAHLGVFQNQMVQKKAYLNDQELTELLALCSILPGPTSTQTLTSIGYKVGGPKLAFLTLMVWALPAVLIMGAFSFLPMLLEGTGLSTDILRYIGPLSVGFILVAAFRISSKVIKGWTTAILWALVATLVFFFREPWVFPILLVLGGLTTYFLEREHSKRFSLSLKPKWGYFAAFSILAVGSLALSVLWDNVLMDVFEQFYRYGYLVFGGGQVVVPYMYNEMVDVQGLMTSQEFLSGYGLVQGIPGPMFSFASYAGGMATRDGGTLIQIAGTLVGALGIFLPGTLLIFFIYPLWESIRNNSSMKAVLRGVAAAAGGMMSITVLIILLAVGITPINLIIALVTSGLLAFTPIPSPILVLGAILAGFLPF